MKYWFMAARPKTLFASLGPVILGLALAYQQIGHLDKVIAFLTIACALLLQVSSNLVNDYYDHIKGTDTLDRIGPARAAASGLINPTKLKWGFISTLALSFIIGLFLMAHAGLPIVIIGLSSIFFAWAYTGGPLPLSYLGLGEMAALIFFGPIPVWGTYYLQTLKHDPIAIYYGLIPGFISWTLMAVNNLRDIKTDTKCDKKTLAVRLGVRGARVVAMFGIVSSALITIFLAYLNHNTFLALPLFITFLFLKNWKYILKGPITDHLNNTLAATGKYLFIFCVTLSIGLSI